MHYKFLIRVLQRKPYLASSVTMKIPPACQLSQRSFRTQALGVNRRIPFHSSAMCYSLLPRESDVKVNDQLATTRNLSSLLCKQKFYTNMIDSLEPTSNLSPNEAKVQSDHLKQFYEEFISNQSEIAALVENASFDHQVEISQEVEQKVRQIQTKLEEIISPIKTVQMFANSVINEHSNQTEHLHVVSDFLDSILQKASSLQINLKRILAPATLSSTPAEDVSSGAVKAQIKSSETVSSVPEGVSHDDIEAELESLGSRSYVNQKLKALAFTEDTIYEQIRQNIVYSPKAAGSDHLRPLVDNEYEWFLLLRKNSENNVREFPDILKKIKEISKRVERAVEDYRLYCKGQIPKENFNYLSSKKKADR